MHILLRLIKEISNVFGSKDAGMLLELRKAEPQASDYLAFLKFEQYPKCLDQAIQTRKTLGNCCFIK